MRSTLKTLLILTTIVFSTTVFAQEEKKDIGVEKMVVEAMAEFARKADATDEQKVPNLQNVLDALTKKNIKINQMAFTKLFSDEDRQQELNELKEYMEKALEASNEEIDLEGLKKIAEAGMKKHGVQNTGIAQLGRSAINKASLKEFFAKGKKVVEETDNQIMLHLVLEIEEPASDELYKEIVEGNADAIPGKPKRLYTVSLVDLQIILDDSQSDNGKIVMQKKANAVVHGEMLILETDRGLVRVETQEVELRLELELVPNDEPEIEFD